MLRSQTTTSVRRRHRVDENATLYLQPRLYMSTIIADVVVNDVIVCAIVFVIITIFSNVKFVLLLVLFQLLLFYC